MTINAAEVARLANLARIELSDSELSQMVPKLDVILEALQAVSQFADQEVPPMAHPLGLVNVLRPDERSASFTADQALAGAPDREDDYFRVPRILEDS